MRCPKCTADIGPGEKFCGDCGHPVEAMPSPSASQDQARPQSKYGGSGDASARQRAEAESSSPSFQPTTIPTELQSASRHTCAAKEIRRFEGESREIGGVTLDSGAVNGVAFSADGLRVLFFNSFGVQVRDLTMEAWDREIKDYQPNHAVLSAIGSHVLVGGVDNVVRLWEVGSSRKVNHFEGHTGQITSVAFSPDERFVFSASDDHTIRRWDIETGLEDRCYEGHQAAITNIALLSNGQVLASMAGDRTVRLWDVEGGWEYSDRTLHLDDNYDENLARRFAIHENLVLTCSLIEQGVGVWDLTTKRKVRELVGHTGQLWDVAFSSDGHLAFSCGGSDYVEPELAAQTGSDNLVRVWDVESGQQVATLEGHTADVLCIACSADGRYALTGSKDRTARLWAL